MPFNVPAPEDAVGLLVGYGSIGAHHARVLRARYRRLAVVDTSEGARERALRDHPDAKVSGSLEALAGSGWDFAASRAAVAAWGPSLGALTEQLLGLGVRHLLVEKPMATSVARAHAMVDRAEALDARLALHFQKRISGIVPGLQSLAAEFGLGALVSVSVETGAWCLVTNGIHFLDFACAMFDALPTAVISNARGQAINPRSSDLRFYEGTAVWDFPDGRMLTMTFNNQCSVAGRLRLWYRDGVIDMDPANGFHARVAARRKEDIERFPAVTRTGPASEMLFSGAVPGMLELAAWTPAFWQEVDSGNPLSVSPRVAAHVLGACIGALTAGELGARIELPLDPASAHARREWPIS